MRRCARRTRTRCRKAAGDLLAGFYADAHGLRVVRPRAFNHAGPGQPPLYAVASFARQVAAGLEAGDEPIRVVTGNPDARRDFTDVRDVVRAYRLLAGRRRAGRLQRLLRPLGSSRELIEALAAMAGVELDHVVDGALVRAHEVMEVRGSADRLHAATGWEPEIRLERTLADTVAWWREGDPRRSRRRPPARVGATRLVLPAGVAQLVEHRPCKTAVRGSSPLSGFTHPRLEGETAILRSRSAAVRSRTVTERNGVGSVAASSARRTPPIPAAGARRARPRCAAPAWAARPAQRAASGIEQQQVRGTSAASAALVEAEPVAVAQRS